MAVIEPSAERVTPRCPHFGVCGGCALQHLSPVAQLAFKQTQLLENLDRIGGVTPREILPPLGASSWSYRRRARLGVKYVAKKGRVLVGFRERARRRTSPTCTSAASSRRRRASSSIRWRRWCSRFPSPSACRRSRSPSPRTAARWCCACWRRLAAKISSGWRSSSASVACAFTCSPAVWTPWPRCRADAAALRYSLPEFDLELEFLPTDFVQINAELNALMVSRAVELLQLVPTDTVLDLFCGIGNFSLPAGAARRARRGRRGRRRARRACPTQRRIEQNPERGVPHGRSGGPVRGPALGRPALRPRAASTRRGRARRRFCRSSRAVMRAASCISPVTLAVWRGMLAFSSANTVSCWRPPA